MTVREYFEIKAKEVGYDDFLHYIDCGDYEKQPDELSKWATEWHEKIMNNMFNVLIWWGELSTSEQNILNFKTFGTPELGETDELTENETPIKSDYQKLVDRIESLEHKQDIIWNNIFMATQCEIVKGGEDKKKILLKGRVDKLENFHKMYFGDNDTGFYC